MILKYILHDYSLGQYCGCTLMDGIRLTYPKNKYVMWKIALQSRRNY